MAALDRPTEAGDAAVSAAARRLRRAGLPAVTETDNATDLTAELEAFDTADSPPSTDPTPYDHSVETGETPAVRPVRRSDVTEAVPAQRSSPSVPDTEATPMAGVPVVTSSTATLPATVPVARTSTETVPKLPVLVRPARTDEPKPTAAARAPKQSTYRRGRPRVRRVRRVVRSIDTWTVFKVSVLFYIVLYGILLIAGVLLWNLAYATGTIDNLENFFESFGWDTFEFNGGQIYHSGWVAGLFMAAGGTGLNVVLATVFNLIADLVGGVGVTVLEEEVRIVAEDDGSRRTTHRLG